MRPCANVGKEACPAAFGGTGSLATRGADGGFTGPIGRLLTRLAAPRMLKQAHIDLEVLRRNLETREAAAPTPAGPALARTRADGQFDRED
jgi:hypothetical protein